MISFGDYSIIAVLLLLSVKGQSQPIRIPAKLTPTIDACPADQDTDDMPKMNFVRAFQT